MPKKICSYYGCNEVIPFRESRCEKHKVAKQHSDKERYKRYDASRQNEREHKFYKTGEWLIVRAVVLDKYKGTDIYIYFTEDRIVSADTAHHIIELKEDWSLRLEPSNLFPLSSGTHKIIHGLYDSGKKKETQELLRNMLDKWNEMFKGEGESIKF